MVVVAVVFAAAAATATTTATTTTNAAVVFAKCAISSRLSHLNPKVGLWEEKATKQWCKFDIVAKHFVFIAVAVVVSVVVVV